MDDDTDSSLEIAVDDYTINMSSMSSSVTLPSSWLTSNSSYGNVTVSAATGSAGSFLTSNGANGTSWTTAGTSSSHATLKVTGTAEFDSDVTIKGVSIAKTLEDIQSRLAILVPDPAKLEHFAALKKAYEHYKTLEALCEIPKEEDKE
jgi:hypothetical protein